MLELTGNGGLIGREQSIGGKPTIMTVGCTSRVLKELKSTTTRKGV